MFRRYMLTQSCGFVCAGVVLYVIAPLAGLEGLAPIPWMFGAFFAGAFGSSWWLDRKNRKKGE